jgi:hypothetical protein
MEQRHEDASTFSRLLETKFVCRSLLGDLQVARSRKVQADSDRQDRVISGTNAVAALAAS